MIRLLLAIIRFPLTGGPEAVDWNARLAASLRPNPQYLKRRRAAQLGWRTRRG
jgi:hypothetical protein